MTNLKLCEPEKLAFKDPVKRTCGDVLMVVGRELGGYPRGWGRTGVVSVITQVVK